MAVQPVSRERTRIQPAASPPDARHGSGSWLDFLCRVEEPPSAREQGRAREETG